ncbi:MAG: DUF1045 domain-containing protein [Pseudomonadota bacterium]
MNYARYAIYYTPPAGTPLAEFGAAWLGWDSASGSEVPHPQLPGFDVAKLTQTPRKYGFHGTVKPPFRLAPGTTADGLAEATAKLCRSLAPVTLDSLTLTQLGRFLALTPTGNANALAALAARTVQELDSFRAAPTEAELAKRRAARLNPAQEAHLTRWGYPYVMDQFRFHLTLTGRLDNPAPVAEALRPLIPRLEPYVIASLTLLGEAPDGRFHALHSYALTG